MNNLQNDTEFLKTEYIPTLLKAVGISQSYALTKLVEDYYFRDYMMGDLELMTPGSIDVSATLFRQLMLSRLRRSFIVFLKHHVAIWKLYELEKPCSDML